jgi:nucleoside-diphosphate-sugar epimerase
VAPAERLADSSAGRVLILGCGYAGRAVARLARSRGISVVATVRSLERERALTAEGFHVERAPTLEAANVGRFIDSATHVVIAFPPDGSTEAALVPLLARAFSVTAISTTAIYGELRGVIDDATPIPPPTTPRALRASRAEAEYRRAGATVLRCPGIYGPERGLHVRVLSGRHLMSEDGARTLSRIHVEDLAQLILATRGRPARTFVVGDLAPAPQLEVVNFICSAYAARFPETAPPEAVPESLRADRSIDGSAALAELGVTLTYPTYREGMAPSATKLDAASFAEPVEG